MERITVPRTVPKIFPWDRRSGRWQHVQVVICQTLKNSLSCWRNADDTFSSLCVVQFLTNNLEETNRARPLILDCSPQRCDWSRHPFIQRDWLNFSLSVLLCRAAPLRVVSSSQAESEHGNSLVQFRKKWNRKVGSWE